MPETILKHIQRYIKLLENGVRSALSVLSMRKLIKFHVYNLQWALDLLKSAIPLLSPALQTTAYQWTTEPDRTYRIYRTGLVSGSVRSGLVFSSNTIPNFSNENLRIDFTFKSSKVAISFQSHLVFRIQSFKNLEAGYI